MPKSDTKKAGTAGRRGGGGGRAAGFPQRLSRLRDLLQRLPGWRELAPGGFEAGGELAHPRLDRMHQRDSSCHEDCEEPEAHQGRADDGGGAQTLQAADEGPQQGIEQQRQEPAE